MSTLKYKHSLFAGLALLSFSLFLSSCKRGQDYEVFYKKAEALYAERLYKEAIPLLKKASKKKSLFIKAKLMCAKAFFFTEDFSSAKKELESLLKKEKACTEGRLLLIRTLIFSGDTEAALLIIKEEETLNPGDYRLWYLYSLLDEKEEKLDQLLSHLEFCDFLLSDSAKVYSKLSDAWNFLGEKDKALKYKLKMRSIK